MTTTAVKYLTPAQVCEIVPGMSKNNLAILRYKGTGPRYYQPTGPRGLVVYVEEEVREWVTAGVRTGTAETAR